MQSLHSQNQCLNILYCLVNLICMMTREEKNENLNTFSVIVTDLAVTFDMGLEFTTMIAKGALITKILEL